MANKPALNAIRKSFDKKLQGAADLFSAVHLTRLPTSVGSHYMTWSSWSDVVDRAQLFFQAGAPFSTLTHLHRDRITDTIRIRNRIAHSSTKVRNDFNEVARRHLGLAPDKKLSQGYDVGQLLLDKSTKCFANCLKQATYFERYAHLFYEMADHICPAPTEANGA